MNSLDPILLYKFSTFSSRHKNFWLISFLILQFNALYESAIDASEKSVVPAKRIVNIIDYLTYQIYLYVQRGLFERHKLIFALMLTLRILTAQGKVKLLSNHFMDSFIRRCPAKSVGQITCESIVINHQNFGIPVSEADLVMGLISGDSSRNMHHWIEYLLSLSKGCAQNPFNSYWLIKSAMISSPHNLLWHLGSAAISECIAYASETSDLLFEANRQLIHCLQHRWGQQRWTLS